MRRMSSIFVFLTLVCVTAASAQVSARVGYYGLDLKRAFVGVDYQFGTQPFRVTPGIDFTRSSGVNLYLASVDLQYAAAVAGSSSAWWIGAGPTYARATFGGASGHAWGGNVNTGYEWKMSGWTPYVTLRYVKIKSGKTAGAALGFRFGH
jgi:hypothetical protein